MKEFFAILGVAVLFFFMPLIITLIGAFSGWVVGLFLSETMLGFFASLGITGFKLWQIGAALGFVGSFFQPNVTTGK